MKKLLLLLFVFTISFQFNSQTTNLGIPIGWKGKLNLNNIPKKVMPGYNQAKINNEDAINDALKSSPWRFGYKYNVNYSLQNSGIWSTLPNGDRIWQISIECKEAITINILLNNYFLPEGASLYLYDINKTNRVGAYTNRNNRSDGELGTELVHGQKIIVEYFEPSNVMGQGRFTISNVIHGYRSLDIVQNKLSRALNSSGDCNIDVNCPLGNGWDNEIRSVAMIVVGGSGICTGALVNNTCNDGTPYFLTANHCLGGGTGSWAFRFNWQSPPGTESCATTANSVDPGPPYDQTANGATILASGTSADFALLELNNMTLTDAQTWNCFFAGWDASDATTVTQATCIHHPSGDVKKICRENDAPYHSNAGGASVWYINQWEEGVTEPGSSGSPLFDQNHRVIGQLYGGAAACSGTNNNGQYDYYGRLGISWNSGVSNYLSSSSCGVNTTTDNGWDPNTPTLPNDAGISAISSPSGAYCVDYFDVEMSLRNYGTNNLDSVTINYGFDGVTNNVYNWTGNLLPNSSETIVFPNVTTTGGSHTFSAFTTLPNGSIDSNPLNDAASTSYVATIGGQDILLELNTDCWGSEITWTIEDANSNVLASGGPYSDVSGGEYVATNICLAVGCYDFIINDGYGDGMYGSQWNSCSVDGDYTITDLSSGSVLASTIAANADYGSQEINNFCVPQAQICGMNVTSNVTQPQCSGIDNGSINVSVSGGSSYYAFNWANNLGNDTTLTSLSPGIYSLTITDSLQCDTIIDYNLSYLTNLFLTTSLYNISCNGANNGSVSVNVTGSSGLVYDWGAGFGNVSSLSGLSAGTYSVNISDINGCEDSAVFNITEPPADSVGFNYNINGFRVDFTNISTPGSYSWDFGDGSTSSSNNPWHTYPSPGNYTACLNLITTCSDINYCNNITIGDSGSVGINTLNNESVKVYPNPSEGVFVMDVFEKLNFDNKITIQVLDLAGRVVFKNETTQMKSIIDLSKKSNGVYFLKVNTQHKQMLRQIIKNN